MGTRYGCIAAAAAWGVDSAAEEEAMDMVGDMVFGCGAPE